MKNISIVFSLFLVFGTFAQGGNPVGSVIKKESGSLSEDLKGDTKKKTDSDVRMPDLGKFTLTIDNTPKNFSGYQCRVTLFETQASTTNTSFLSGRIGVSKYGVSGFNAYAGVYSMYTDGLKDGRPFKSAYEREDRLGSVYKTRAERGFEANGFYLFQVGYQALKNRNRVMISKRKADTVYIWSANVDVIQSYSIAPYFGYEKGQKEYKMNQKSGLMLNPMGPNSFGRTEVLESYYYTQSTVQNYTNLKFGLVFQMADLLTVDAEQHGFYSNFKSVRLYASLLYGIENDFDDVYGSTYSNGDGSGFESWILDRYSVDDVNEKTKTGAELIVEYQGATDFGVRVFARKNPGFKKLPSVDLGGSVFFNIGKIKRKK